MLLSDRHAVVGIIPSEMTKSCPGNFALEEDAQEVVEGYWDKKSGTPEFLIFFYKTCNFHLEKQGFNQNDDQAKLKFTDLEIIQCFGFFASFLL